MAMGLNSIPMRTRRGLLSETTALLQQPKVIGSVLGTILLVLLPYFHLGVLYTFWNANKPPVDKKTCTNQCWDTLFKGSYESGGRSGYKHIYFNITHQTFKIWALSTVVAICFYEMIKYLTRVLMRRETRLSMLVLLCTDVYPHYYGWWMYFNAWNDDFYKQWYHQGFFSLTELSSTLVILYLCCEKHPFRPLLALVVITIGLLHILVSSGDQFISNVLFSKGAGYQYYRDIGFMVPDFLHMLLPGYELVIYARRERLPLTKLFSLAELVIAGSVIVLLWIVVRLM